LLEFWVIVLLVVSASFAADSLGEPPLRIHPVVLIGRLAGYLDRELRFTDRLRLAGVVLWVVCVGVPVALSAFLHFTHYIRSAPWLSGFSSPFSC